MVVKISVVIPVFNTEIYLKKCLDSILNQTLQDFEIICVNDGSTDSSLDILNSYSKKDERIKIINQKNSGPGAARNRGLLECKGEFISFIDSDDWISENLFEKTYEQLNSDDLDFIFFPSITYDDDSGEYDEDNEYYNLSSFKKDFSDKVFNYKDRLLGLPTDPIKIYRKDFLFKNKIKFPENIYFEDNVFFFDVYLRSKRCAICWDVSRFKRFRKGAITEKMDNKYFDLVEVYTLIVETFKETGVYNELNTEFLNYIIFMLSWRYTLIESQYKKEFYCMISQFFKDLNLSEKEFNSLSSINKTRFNKFMHYVGDKDLFVSYAFPPFSDTSGIVVAIRIFYNNSKVDIVQNNLTDFRDYDYSLNKIVEEKIDKRFITDVKTITFNWGSIKNFVLEAKNQVDEYTACSYNRIYSRAMLPESHFFGFEYKLEHPETYWIAEFSDPILYGMNGKQRSGYIYDKEYIDRLNNLLTDLNLPSAKENVAFLCEYIPFVFADEIIFNNENQMKFMCDNFPYEEIKDIIIQKSKIKPIHTLPEDFYYKVDSDYLLDEFKVNLAYFGVFYGARNFEGLYYALENLDESFKDKFCLHVFTKNKDFIELLISDLDIKDNIIVNDYVDFLEFLNLCTKFDCLIVNDSEVKHNISINPYLPSKLRDYLGSGSDVWGICEEDSLLSKQDIKYKSYLNSYNSIKKTLNQILSEKLDIPIKDEIDEMEEIRNELEFLKKRNNFLNTISLDFNLRFHQKIRHDPCLSKNRLIKKQLLDLSNIKSYKIAYFLNLTKNKFFKGDMSERKLYLKWLFSKIRGKDFYYPNSNPLLNIINKL